MANLIWESVDIKQAARRSGEAFASIGQGRITLNADACDLLLFFKLFATPCCTLFTTIFKIIPNATSHYASPIMHIKYCYPKTKHII